MTINPVFTCEPVNLPRDELPPGQLDPDTAYQVVHDELMLDGNARLTWPPSSPPGWNPKPLG